MAEPASASHSRRREKPVLSCTLCRSRKLRCDRQSPCGACQRRGQSAECTFSSSEKERRDAVDYRPHARGQRARQRMARLEELVAEMRDLAQGPGRSDGDTTSPSVISKDHPSPLSPTNSQGVGDAIGNLNLTDEHAVYTGSSHWATILEDIQHIKDELAGEYANDTPTPEPNRVDEPLIHEPTSTGISLLNSAPSLTREQILAMLPPRKVVDRHVSHFFNTFDIAAYIIRRDRFLAEYTNFWSNPSAAPIMWIGLLCSIMTISAFLQQRDPGGLSSVDSRDALHSYRTLTIHCLAAGDYLRSNRYTLETLTLHFAVEQNFAVDASVRSWILIGVIIRIALRMGMHRDPSHWPSIRPLQAELRRRLWMVLYQMDFFTSTQVGLPRIIKDHQCDTRPPAHLSDGDLGFEHGEIPPERPSTTFTPLLHVIQRYDIIKIAAEIYDATEAGPLPPAMSAALAAKLEQTIAALPASARYKPLEAPIFDNPVMMLNQMVLDILIHKAIYLLHRRSFVKGCPEGANDKPNELCIKAALEILKHQRRLSEETQPGGIMFAIRWKVAYTLNHEFLQATMMLCFVLSRPREETHLSSDSYLVQSRDDIVLALTHARELWENIADQSMEAQRAIKAITAVLQQDSREPIGPTQAASGGFFDQIPEQALQSNFGNFEYGEDMALDPSFFENDPMGLGSIWDDFVTEPGHM